MSALNYRHLHYFRAVAHDGTLTRAAGRLNLSQSALSSQIKQLEARLGHALFDRHGRSLVLTEAGRIALDHADAIFARGEELMATLRGAGSGRQAIRVGALATLSRNFQIAFLRPLLARRDVEVVLRSGSAADLLRALDALALDVVLLNQPPPRDMDRPLVSHRLAEQRVSLVGRADLLAAPAALDVLLNQHPVILPAADSGIRIGFDALVARLGLRPQIAAEVDDMAMMRLLTREGIGLGVLPPIVVTDEIEIGLLVEADPLPGIVETFYAVTMERRFPNALLGELLAAQPTALRNAEGATALAEGPPPAQS